MDPVGSRVEFSLASGRGATAIVASTGDVAIVAGAATGTGRPIPRAVDFAVGSVTVTPVEADGSMVVVDVALKEAVALTAVADVPTVEEVVASVEADEVTAEGDTPMAVAEDMASVEAGIASVEVVPTVVGAGRFHHELDALAADGTCCRPPRF